MYIALSATGRHDLVRTVGGRKEDGEEGNQEGEDGEEEGNED
jgi:hypothetical protein